MNLANSVSGIAGVWQDRPGVPPSITSVLGSTKSVVRYALPPELWLKAAFGELKLDLHEASFPAEPIRLVAESLCSSVEVLLPRGATVVDRSGSLFSNHRAFNDGEAGGPVVCIDGWSVCSDVQFVSR